MSDSEDDHADLIKVTDVRRRITVPRETGYNVVEFEEKFRKEPESKGFKEAAQTWIGKKCTMAAFKKSFWTNLPFLKIFRSYKLNEDLPNDLVAGITVGIMMIPQGMAFGALSTLTPIVGLYISLFAPLTYFFFGTSRQASMGCIAILSLMMATILDKYDASKSGGMCDYNVTCDANGSVMIHDPSEDSKLSPEVMVERIEVAGAVTLAAGLITMIAGKCGMGIVITFMSNSLITAFTVGVSVHVFTSQVKNIFGLTLPRHNGMGKLVLAWYDLCAKIPSTNLATVIISVICLIILYLVKAQINERFKHKMRIPIPIELIVVIFGTIASQFAYFEDNYNVPVVGSIPVGVPAPRIPNLLLAKDYIVDGVLIIIVAYAQTVSMAKTLGMKNNYKIDLNQEMFATGAACVACALFSGYITAASVSRSIVQDGAGGRTQITSLVACGVVLLVIMVLGPYLFALPLCVLSCIIIVNLRGMFMKILTLKSLWKESPYDCVVWVTTFLGSVLLDVQSGLVLGFIVNLLTVCIRAQLSTAVIVGEVSSAGEYRREKNYTEVQETAGVKTIRLDAPVYFANADIFVTKVFKLTGINPLKWKKRNMEKVVKMSNGSAPKIDERTEENGNGLPENDKVEIVKDTRTVHVELLPKDDIVSLPHHIILDLSGVTFLDIMGVKALTQVVTAFNQIEIKVLIAETREKVLKILKATGFMESHGDVMYLTMESALVAATSQSESSDA